MASSSGVSGSGVRRPTGSVNRNRATPSQSTPGGSAVPRRSASPSASRSPPGPRTGGRGGGGGGGSVASGRRSYVKTYSSWRDESLAGESTVSLGSVDENGEFAIPDELVRSIGLDCYSTEEKAQLDDLLQRLLAAKKQEERRKEKLRRELNRTMAQVSKVQNRGDKPPPLCSLCELCGARMYPVHRRYVCNRCGYLACRDCVYLVHGAEPQCRLCRLEVLNDVKSGDWFLTEARRRSDQVYTGPEVLYASMCKERQRMVAEERQRQEQKRAAAEAAAEQERLQQLEARQGKRGKKDQQKKAAAAAAAASSVAASAAASAAAVPGPSSLDAQRPPVAINIQTPNSQELPEIHPEDSVSVVGSRRDDVDADIVQLAPSQPPSSDRNSQLQQQQQRQSVTRATNLLAINATSRESMVSNVSETDASYAHGLSPTGEVELTLQYNYKEHRFTVTVVQCRNLLSLEGHPPNPYVKTYLLPDKTKRSKRRTQTRRATANPIYSEQLVYGIPKSELETRTLQVSVWHSVTFGSNMFLGEARITMENYRFESGPASLQLERRVEVPVPLPTLMYRGDIMLAIRYLSGELIKANQLANDDPAQKTDVAGRLEVWVQNCRNLAGSGGSSSPYVKGYLTNPSDTARSRSAKNKQKSAIVKGDMNPNFNSILAFEKVSIADLQCRSLELTVWDHVKIGKNDFLGGVRLNTGDGRLPTLDSRGHESLMWNRMLENPNSWIEGSLLLRPNMDPQEPQRPPPLGSEPEH